MVRADLHTHLRNGSVPGRNDFNLVIDTASRRLDAGNGAVFALANVLDNRYESFISLPGYNRDYIGDAGNAVYVPKKNVLVIKAQEIPTKEGHLLVLGLAKDFSIKENMTLEQTIAAAQENCGVIIAPHPFYASGIGHYLETRPHLLDGIDAIEVHNGEASLGIPFMKSFPRKANKRARGFYEIKKFIFPNLGAISASDGHSIYELGTSWVDIVKPSFMPGRFYSSLKSSVRRTRDSIMRHNGRSIFGVLCHAVALAVSTAKSKLLKENQITS